LFENHFLQIARLHAGDDLSFLDMLRFARQQLDDLAFETGEDLASYGRHQPAVAFDFKRPFHQAGTGDQTGDDRDRHQQRDGSYPAKHFKNQTS